MFYHFFQTPVLLNNQQLVINDAQLSNEIQLSPKYYYDDRVSFSELPTSTWAGSLKLKYYLTGQDYLKQFMYSNENSPISGYIAGMSFNFGYLSNYSLRIEPNQPVSVNAEIQFFEMLSGNFNPSPFSFTTGFIFNSADIQINNLSNYTKTPINIFSDATIEYSCNLKENYNYFDTGVIPTAPDNVFFHDRTLNFTINCDNTYIPIALSGENFGVIFNFSNPSNTGLNESIGCSGLISSKIFSINPEKPHSTTIKISQHNIGKKGSIFSASNNNGVFTVNFTTGSFPLLSQDGTLNYIEKISVGDTPITGYTINRTANYDQIVAPTPFNVVDDILTVYTSYGNYVYPNKIHFSYSPITISGMSSYTGNAGQTIIITGSNFIRVSDVIFGGNTPAQFQVNNPQTIQATIPYGGTCGQVLVSSYLRGVSGYSNLFYYPPIITNIIPNTGQWLDTISITGSNFSGVTGVLFNNVPAYTYSVTNPNLIVAQAPQTGQGFTNGYISVVSSGGSGQSISLYNPVIPVYSFSPISGVPRSVLNINTKIDTGYLCPQSGGYKVNIGGQDTTFYLSGLNSTGTLSGLVPLYSSTNYVYIYQPDGISTSASSSMYNVVGFPNVDYLTPSTINRYADFSMLLVGQNLNNFNGLQYYLSFSGYFQNDVQYYGNQSFNNAADGSAVLATNLNITGNTGYYDVNIYNSTSGFNVVSGLFVNSPYNQAFNCKAVYGGGGGPAPTYFLANNAISPSWIIGQGGNVTQIPAALTYTSVASGASVIVTPLSVGSLKVSTILVNPNYDSLASAITGYGFPTIETSPGHSPSGCLQIWKNNTVLYDSTNKIPNYLMFSGLSLIFTPPLSGVTKIIYFTASGPPYLRLPIVTQIY